MSESCPTRGVHVTVEDVIVLRGGRIAYSTTVDSTPRMVVDRDGQPIAGTRCRCSRCGERGHARSRCNGKGQPPLPTSTERRRARKLAARLDELPGAALKDTP